MKKLALLSLLAVFAVTGAHAANTINGNPLYRPDGGKFYSVTSLGSHSENTNAWGLGEEFGYGITDKLAVILGTTVSESNTFDRNAWNDFSLGLNYRAFEQGKIKADVFGSYRLDSVWGDHASFLDKTLTSYAWTVGARVGYVADDFTIAGHFAFDYLGSESFNWGDEGWHRLRLGLDAQYLIDSNWNVIAGVEYTGRTDDGVRDAGEWTGAVGANYNIDEDKYVGVFAGWAMRHATGDWELDDGFEFGAKFGIQF
ncbi:MAG: hypothetical protein LBJ73_04725 [Rickettsiales bacterium]|jgi:hypothetical protein|nr:hypothetical protein [Rickettsiales bacterium]